MSHGIMKHLIPIVLAALFNPFVIGCGNSTTPIVDMPESSDIAEIASKYHRYELLTAEPYVVNPWVTNGCYPITQDTIDNFAKVHGPHAIALISVYMNKMAANAYRQQTEYPLGSIIVKQKSLKGDRSDDGKKVVARKTGVGGMIKRQSGYDPTHGNWEYFYYETLDSITAGRVQNCIGCHEKASKSDYVFGTWAENDSTDGNNNFGY